MKNPTDSVIKRGGGDLRLRAKNASPNSEAFFTALFDSIESPILIINPKTAAILDVNEAACRFYGYSHTDFIQKKILDLAVIPADEAWQRIRKIAEGEITHMTLQHRLSSGEIRDVVVDLGRNIFDTMSVNIATIHDITELKQAERTLQESEQKYHGFVSQANEALTLVNEQGVVIEWNPASEQLTGIPASEVLGQFVWDVQLRITSPDHITTEMRDLMRQRIQPVLETGSGPLLGAYETEIKRADGKTITVAQRLFTIKTAQGFHLGTIARDITQERQDQRELKSREERYRSLFKNMREGFALQEIIQDETGHVVDFRFIDANPAYEEHTGQRPGEILGHTIRETMPNADPAMIKQYGNVALTGEPLDLEYFSKTFNRHIRVRSFRPQPNQFASIFEDITERKTAEFLVRSINAELEKQVQERTDELSKSEFRTQMAIRGSNSGTWEWNVQTGETVFNERWAEIVGYTLKELEPISIQTWENLCHPDDLKRSSEQLNQCFSRESEFYHCEVRMKHKDGSWIWVSDRGQVMEWTADGRPLYMFGTHIDITELKQAEEELLMMSNLLTEGQKIAHLGSFEYIVATQQTIWSEEQFHIYGYDPSQPPPDYNTLVAKSLLPDDVELIAQTFINAVQNHTAYELEHRVVHPDGGIHWVYERADPHFDEAGQLTRYIGVSLDITERKHAEQKLSETNIALTKALRVRDEFMAAMSHELRTPLTGILGLTEMLQVTAADVLNERQLNYVAIIEKNGQRLLDTISNVMDYTQLQGGIIRPNFHPCRLNEISHMALRKTETLAKNRQQSIRYVFHPLEIKINTDDKLLHKILCLLLDNASKFTAKGGEFGLDVTGQSEAGLVEITVWDTGIGIAEDNLSLLFKPFAQLDPSLTRQYEGTGLGLALVKSISELLKGTMSVQSILGKGSRFTITLPWEDA